MAIEGAGSRANALPAQPLPTSGAAEAPGASSVSRASLADDVSALPKDRIPVLAGSSRPSLPDIREDLLGGLTPQEAYAALASKLQDNRTRSAEDRIDTAARLRVTNTPARQEVVSKASENFFSKLWDAVVKTVTSNPGAVVGLVVTTVTSIAGVVASGGAGIPAAIAAISAAAAPFVAAVAANAGVDLDQLLARGIEEVLTLAGVDRKSAWKASQIVGSVINVGVSIGAAVVAGNPAVFDVSRVGQLVASIADAFDMKASAVRTIENTVQGFASLGMLIGGSIASGANVLSYGGLDTILANGDAVFKKIIDSFSQGVDLKKLGEAGTELVALVPLLQKLFDQAFVDLQSHGSLIDGLADSFQAIVEHVDQSTSLAQDALALRGMRG